jgi:hypothetical protein
MLLLVISITPYQINNYEKLIKGIKNKKSIKEDFFLLILAIKYKYKMKKLKIKENNEKKNIKKLRTTYYVLRTT